MIKEKPMKKTLLLFLLILAVVSVFSQEKKFITDWLVLGTFQNPNTLSLLDDPYIADESTVTPSSGGIYDGRSWFPATTAPNGRLDFLTMGFAMTDYSAVYAHVYIHSNGEENVYLLTGSDDGNEVFLNGMKISAVHAWRSWHADTDTVLARLGIGWNRLLIKVVNGEGDFALSARLTTMDGKPFPGLDYSPDNPFGKQPFVETMVHPWLVAGALNFDDHFQKVKNNKSLNLILSYKILGNMYPELARVAVRCLDDNQNTVMEKNDRITSFVTGEHAFAMDLNDMVPVLQNGKLFTADFEWDGHKASYSFPVHREQVFEAVLNDHEEDMPATLADKLTYLGTNLPYARIFYPDTLRPSDETIQVMAYDCMTSQWPGLEKDVNPMFGAMKNITTGLKQNTVYFTGNAHIDMAWLWKFEETVEVCYETFESALKLANKYPDFIYCQSQAQAYWWMENRFPGYFEKIKEKVKNGQWEIVGGMWVEPDLNMPSGEALVRQFLYGKRYFMQKFGVDVKIGFNPDSFGYCWTLPQIMRKAGITTFITQKLTWNDTNKFPYKIFWWEAPDGSRVLAIFPFTYTHTGEPHRIAQEFMEHKNISGTTDQLVLYGVGNHGGGPTQENIDNIQLMKNLDAFPVVREASCQTFSDMVLGKYHDLPSWDSELYLEYHRGTYTTQAHNKKSNRLSEIYLEEAEKLAMVSGLPYPVDELHEAWRLTMFNQFHDILPGSGIGPVYEDSKVQYENVHRLTARVIGWSLDTLLRAAAVSGKGVPLIVFNPLTQARHDPVISDLPQDYHESLGLYDAAGKEIPYEVDQGQMIFSGVEIPPIGYRILYLREGRSSNSGNSSLFVQDDMLENEYLRVTVDTLDGTITGIYDKEHNRQVLADGGRGNVLQLFEDRPSYWDAWNIGYTGREWDITDVRSVQVVSNNSQRVALRIMKGRDSSMYSQTLMLYCGLPRLDIVNTVEWHEDHKLLKAAFDVAPSDDTATYEIPFGYIGRPTVYRNSFDSARFEVSGHKWIDLTDRDGTYGVSLLNDCKYGFDVKVSTMRISLLRSPKWPDPNADMGTHTFTYAIYPHAGSWQSGGTYQQAYELNYPLLSQIGTAPEEQPSRPNTMPESYSFVTTDRPNIMISAVKKAEDDDEVIMRFYETWGKETGVEFEFGKQLVSARETDLLERPESTLTPTGNKLTVHVKPFEIITLALRFAE